MIFVAVFLIMFNFSFFSEFHLLSGISLEGLKYLPVLYIAFLHLLITSGNVRNYRSGNNLNIIKIYVSVVALSLLYSMSKVYTLRSLVPWISIYMILHIIEENIDSYRPHLKSVFSKIIIICMVVSSINLFIGIVSREAFVLDDSGATRIGFIQSFPYWYVHSIAITGFIYYYKGRLGFNKKYLLVPLLIAIFFISFGVRTYILAFILSIILIEAFFIVNSKIKTFNILLTSTLLIILFVFTYEPFRTKMFLVESHSATELLKNIRLSDRDKIAAYLINISYEYSGLITGTGAGTAKYILEKEKTFDNTLVSHSDYTRVITEFGVPGLLLYLALLFLWLRQSIRLLRTSKSDLWPYACAYTSSICFIAIGGLAYDLFAPVSVFSTYMLYFLSTGEATSSADQLTSVDSP